MDLRINSSSNEEAYTQGLRHISTLLAARGGTLSQYGLPSPPNAYSSEYMDEVLYLNSIHRDNIAIPSTNHPVLNSEQQ